MQKKTIRAAEEIFLAAFFIVAISLPLGLLLIRGEGTPAWENRRLAEFPARPTSASEAFHLPRMLFEYFKDHFALRADLIRWQATAKVGWLRSSSSPEVLLGKDGWLFHSGEKEVELFSGSEPFTAEELEQWRLSLEGIRDWLKPSGATFVLTFTPEKQTIYPEQLPGSLVRMREESRQDQLIEYLKKHSDIRVVDLRPALREAKTANQIYFRTDTHWNDLGAFTAYRVLAAELGRDFKAIQPMSASDVEVYAAPRSGDLAGMLGLRGVMTEAGVKLRVKQPHARLEGNCGDMGQCVSERTDDAALPHLVMYRDSFSSYMIPFVAEHFSRAVYVWDIKWKFSPALVEAERPDVVVLEMVERNLMRPPPSAPPDARALSGARGETPKD
ncbi:MAG: alginate O-acetyltransferase complex protein AlgJ [Acidobacteriota bacterium]|nr:alginate O-acetyltransferase complex protein AlgJ [Acidobacteriota bacterium]